MVMLLKQQQQLNSLLSSQLPFSNNTHLPPPSAQLLLPYSPDPSSSTLKSSMNSQLLCTQALLESNEFKLLPYDNISQIKKTISKLESQLGSLSSKLKLELKILQASHLIRPGVNLLDDLDRFPERFKRLYDQKESIQSQLSDLRTLLFQHLSAALALGYKKLEHLLNNPPFNPHHTQLTTSFNLLRSPSPPSAHPSSRSNRSTTFTRFDGPHMFASDQSGSSIFSLPSHQNSSQPFRPPSSPGSKSNGINQSNLLKEEIASLKALLKSKDSVIAEQSSDLNLLELEVETLKQSLSDQSSNHLQLSRDQSSSQKDLQVQIEALQSQNSKLTQALQSSNDQVDSTTNQLNQLKLQVEQLNLQLTNERSNHGTRQKSNEELLQEADNRVKLVENSHSELKLNASNLKSQLDLAQQSTQTAQAQVEKLQIELKASQDREIDFQSAIDSLQTKSISKEQDLLTREAENKADWEFLIDRLLTLNPKLNEDQTNPSKLSRFFSQLSSSPYKLEILNDRKKLSEQLGDNLVDYFTMLNTQLAILKAENNSSSIRSTSLTEELDKLRQTSNQQISELTVRLNELETQNEELQKQSASHQSNQENSKIDSTQMDSLKLELANVKQQLAEKESSKSAEKESSKSAEKESLSSIDGNLRELWKLLPSNLDSRAVLNLDSDLSQLKTLYESPKKTSAAVAGGLGGLFGLGRRAATPTTPLEEPEFSTELMLEKIRLIVENDRKLIDRLIKYDSEKESHKNNSLRAQKLVTESQEALRTYQSQVAELQERLEYAHTQLAAMLEKVNDLMESEERSKAIARRAELNVQKLQAEIESLQLQLKS